MPRHGVKLYSANEIFIICFLLISGTNLQYEVATLKEYMIKEFTRKNREPIYESDQFEKFCMEAGAPILFNNILLSMTSDRHSEQRQNQNKLIAKGQHYFYVDKQYR